jgi:hypothetical protein
LEFDRLQLATLENELPPSMPTHTPLIRSRTTYNHLNWELVFLETEAAVHATRRFVESMSACHCVVILYFPNAFNSLHHDAMLGAMLKRIPSIYKLCNLAYSMPSSLVYEGQIIMSKEGLQQGNPLGPALFCTILQPLLL